MAKAKPAAKKPAKKAPAKPAKVAKPAKKAPPKLAKAARPAAAKPVKTIAKAVAKPSPKPSTSAPPTTPVARFGFSAVPIVRDPSGLTPLLRRQLVVDAQLSTGRTTTPDKIPTGYLSPGIVRWRVTEQGKPVLDVVQNTAFFPDSDEPVGLERIAGSWQATGRGTTRGLALDLPYLAWELNRDWPGRRLPLGPEPRRAQKLAVAAGPAEQPWPPGTQFV